MNQPTTDLSAEDHAAVFADPAIAAIRSAGGAVIVAAEHPQRLIHANAAALRLFSQSSRDGLAAKLFGAEPGARRVAALARSLSTETGARLERLRFFFGPVAETLTLLARRVQTPRGALLVLAAPPPRKAALRQPHADDAAPPADGRDGKDGAGPTPEPAPLTPAPAPRLNRFVWQTDRDHRLMAVAPDLAALLGPTAPGSGALFTALATASGADPGGRLAAALAKEGTFASLRLFWPLPGGLQAAPVDLFGVPMLDVARRFSGYRGFGIIHPDRVSLKESAAPQEPEKQAPQDRPQDAETRPAPEAPATRRDNGNVVRLPLPARSELSAQTSAAQTSAADADENAAPPVENRLAPAKPEVLTRGGEPVRLPASAQVTLTESERNAFREIARTLGAKPASERGRAAPPQDDQPDQIEAGPADAHSAPPAETQADPAPARPAAAPQRDILGIATPGRASEAETCCAPTAQAEAAALAPVETAPVETTPANETGPDDPQLSLLTEETEPVASGTEAEGEHAADLVRHAPALLDRLPVGVMVSRGSIPIYANRTLLDLLGYDDIDALHDDGGLDRMFRSRQAEALSEAAQGGAMPIVTRDGAVIPVDGRMQTITWDGDAATLMSFRRSVEGEVAWRMRALELELRGLQNTERELHSILDTATDGVAVIDEQGRILSLNRSAEALFGYEQNEVAGDSFTALLAPSSHRAALDYLDGLKSNGVASVLNDGREVMGRERQGGTIPLFMTLGRVSSANGGKFCAVLRDMTQWKKAERDLETARRDAERASALKSDFLARISHEIRTPLNAILGFAEVIMHERFGPIGNDRYKDYLKDIHASGAHVMSLVNDLLDLSKIEAGKLELTFAATDVNAVVSECVSLMQAQALQDRIILRIALAPRLPHVVADERSLRQIVLNLLSNAVKFNEPGGQVIVSTALTDAGHAVIRVRDTGIGMSESEIDVAMEPFRQLATSRQQGGTGLGLPLTKALVEANRASFSIKSQKAEGTLVEVAFPPTRVLAE